MDGTARNNKRQHELWRAYVPLERQHKKNKKEAPKKTKEMPLKCTSNLLLWLNRLHFLLHINNTELSLSMCLFLFNKFSDCCLLAEFVCFISFLYQKELLAIIYMLFACYLSLAWFCQECQVVLDKYNNRKTSAQTKRFLTNFVMCINDQTVFEWIWICACMREHACVLANEILWERERER